MSRRSARGHRVLALQRQLNRIEQWKLAELQMRLAALDTAQRELIGALNEDHALHGLFIDTMAQRLGSLAEEEAQVKRAKDVQTLLALESATREKLAERMARAGDRDAQREEDARRLLDIVEGLLQRRRDASLP
jgi:hypothetical protein